MLLQGRPVCGTLGTMQLQRQSVQGRTVRTNVNAVRMTPRVPKVTTQRGPARSVNRTIVCGSGVAHPDREDERSLEGSRLQGFDAALSVPSTGLSTRMAKNFGAYQAQTVERSKVSFVLPETKPEKPKLDDGGSGGDIGNRIFNGGGGGDGDGGDDDDYFDDYGEGEGGQGGDGGGFWRVAVLPELYDKVTITAVLQEWMKVLADLPIIIRRAVEMGLVSSAQLTRFLSMDVRPNITRAVTRSLPDTWAREIVGRLMADPAFVHKMVLESSVAAFSSLYYEWWVRRENFVKEWDLVAINTLGLVAASSASFYMTAPSRSYGSVHKLPWQRMLDGLPNMVFDSSGPMRQYTNQARVGGFLAKMAELSAVGFIAGAGTAAAANGAVALRRQMDPTFQPSVPVPDITRSAAGLGAYFALNANTRLQLAGGLDKYMFDRCNHLWAYVGLTSIYRTLSNRVGEMSRPWWQGLPLEPVKRKRRTRRADAATRSAPQYATA